MFNEDTVKDEEHNHDSQDNSAELDNEIDQVLGETIGEMQPSTAEPVDLKNFGEDEEPNYREESYDYKPVEVDYNQDQNDEDQHHDDYPHHRRYSSPPASIYDDTADDGRIRMSEGDDGPDTFTVSDPIKGGHVTYTIRGYDDDGAFEGTRRYNDFFHLRAAIITRWPGVYCPPIPPKKALGNKEDKFLEERKHFLERFLILIGKIDHLIKSDEFRLFSRPSGDIDKTSKMLPQVTSDFLLDRFKSQLNLSEDVGGAEQAENRAVINEYQAFCKQFIKTLKQMRDQIKPYVNAADKQNENYKDMVDMIGRFETHILLEYSDNDTGKQVLSEYLEQSEECTQSLTNPIREFFYWIKGELYDIQALNDCFMGRDRIMKQATEAREQDEERPN